MSPDPHSAPRSTERSHSQQVICIAAAQRTGTTALQYALKAAGEIVNFGEVFHPEPLEDARGTFLSFAQEHDLRLTDTIARKGAVQIAERYLDWLRGMAAPRHLLIDVKLNSWFVLNSWWHYSQSELPFLTCLKRARAVMIFIWRDDLVEQVLSQFIAVELGIWHNLTPAKVDGRTLKAPVDRMRKLASVIARSEADMLIHLQDYPKKVVIRYKDLFRNGLLLPEFRRAFSLVAGFALPANSQAGVRPNSSLKREIIENYDEIVAAIRPVIESRRRDRELRKIG